MVVAKDAACGAELVTTIYSRGQTPAKGNQKPGKFAPWLSVGIDVMRSWIHVKRVFVIHNEGSYRVRGPDTPEH